MGKQQVAAFNWISMMTQAADAVGGSAAAAKAMTGSTFEDRVRTVCGMDGVRSALIASLQHDCAGLDREAVRGKIFPIVVAHYKATTKLSEAKANKGSTVIDRAATGGEAAYKQLGRLTNEIMGAPVKADDVEIPASLLKLAKALADAANEYESGRSLAAKALAAAWAK